MLEKDPVPLFRMYAPVQESVLTLHACCLLPDELMRKFIFLPVTWKDGSSFL